jgi:hypothetical protein
LAKIIIDSFQLRLVDLAAVLTMAECMLEAKEVSFPKGVGMVTSDGQGAKSV